MKLNVLVKEVMKTDIRYVSLDDTIEKAAQVMKKFKVGSVVVMAGENVRGIVTDNDIVYKCVAEKKPPTTKASEIMTKNPVTIPPEKTIEEAARLMSEKNIKKLLVFDRNCMVGIITETDIMRIEPALFEVLLERMKIRSSRAREAGTASAQCEHCGNYADVSEVDGEWLCSECAME